jgi:hypothetical protein
MYRLALILRWAIGTCLIALSLFKPFAVFGQSIEPKDLQIAARANALLLKMGIDEKIFKGWMKNQSLADTKKLSAKDRLYLLSQNEISSFDKMIILRSNELDLSEQIITLDQVFAQVSIQNLEQTIEDLEVVTLLIIEMKNFLMNDQIDLEMRKQWFLPKISQFLTLCMHLVKKAEFYAMRPEKKYLFALQKDKGRFPGEQWLKAGDLPYVLNVILAPATFKAMLDLLGDPTWGELLLSLKSNFDWINKAYMHFKQSSMHFELKVGFQQARNLVRKASQCWQFCPKIYTTEITDDIMFFAIGLRPKSDHQNQMSQMNQIQNEDFDLIKIIHPNPLMIFQFFPAKEAYQNHPLLKSFLSNLTRMYPAGLLTPQGLINSSTVFEEKHPFYEGCRHFDAEKLLEDEISMQQPLYTAYHPALSAYFQQIDHWYQAWLIEGIFALETEYKNSQSFIPRQEAFIFGDLAFFLYYSLLYRLDEVQPFELSKHPLYGIEAEDQPNPLFLYEPIPTVKQLPSRLLKPLPKIYQHLY